MILPKKIEIDKAKAAERKLQIDEGLILARRIDELREIRLGAEKSFDAWRVETSKKIQYDIDQLLETKNNLENQTNQARIKRDELQKPLDKEWEAVRKDRKSLIEQMNEFHLDKERFEIKVNKWEEEKGQLAELISKAKEHEKKTREDSEMVNQLKEDTKKMLSLHSLRIIEESNEWENKTKKVEEQSKEYEVASRTIELREKQVVEKEEELIKREQDLARRTINLQKAVKLK